MDNKPIGIFDSGVGGLTVANQVIRLLENEEIIYFGDTARVPYGSKSKETVTKFSKQDVRFLLSKNVKAIIVGCNTASANSLEELKATFSLPIFGVVEPGAIAATSATKNKRIGVIATSSTIKSEAYKNAILKIDPTTQVFSKACPLFVPLAEEGWANEEITYLTAKKYLADLLEHGVDTIVMGCTHYPLIRKCLQECVGTGITLIDPAFETAKAVKEYLTKNHMLKENTPCQHSFYISDTTDMFEVICNEALSQSYKAEKIDIESF